jgi:hypothetical protein
LNISENVTHIAFQPADAVYPCGVQPPSEETGERSTKDLSLSNRRHARDWTAGMLAVCGVILLTLLGLVMSHTAASDWIAQAAQAEFVGSDVYTPTEFARSNEQTWMVTADKK